MNLILGITGIPENVHDDILKERNSIVPTSCKIISRAHKKQYYSVDDVNFFLTEFTRTLENDRSNSFGTSNLALIYINYDDQSSEKIISSLYPAALTLPIAWSPSNSGGKQLKESKNQLILLLRDAYIQLKKAFSTLSREIAEKPNKTPLLLPIRNFSSAVLPNELKNLYDSIITDPNTVQETIKTINYHHPPSRIGNKPRLCYVDNRDIEFHSPGTSLHGLSRYSEGHPFKCYLSGRRRFGVPYKPAFHYDCIKGKSNLVGLFWGCHEDQANKEGHPHLNIAPNDHVRI